MCELTVTLADGGQRRFELGSQRQVLRIGRKSSSDVVLDFEGVSNLHAELLLEGADGDTPKLCVRDSSRNGCAIRPVSETLSSAWETLERGVARALGPGWQMKVPLKSRRGVKQLSEPERTLTVNFNFKARPAALPSPVKRAPPPLLQDEENLAALAGGGKDEEPPARAAHMATAVPALARRAAVATAEPVSPQPRREGALAAPVPTVPAMSPQEAAASALLNAAVQRRSKKESRKAAAPATSFWQQQVAAAPAPPTPEDRGRSRSRGDGFAFVPRDMSVSPISEPGVGAAKKRKKRPKATLEPNAAGRAEKGAAPKEPKERRKVRKDVREAPGEERPAKKKRTKREA